MKRMIKEMHILNMAFMILEACTLSTHSVLNKLII
jgi:hypothetical protein